MALIDSVHKPLFLIGMIKTVWMKAPQYFCTVYHSTKARDFCVGELETRSNPLLLLLLLSSTTVIFFKGRHLHGLRVGD